MTLRKIAGLGALLSFVPGAAMAEEATLSSDDSISMVLVTALLLMTISGLALVCANMPRAKNVRLILLQCVAASRLVHLLRFVPGYTSYLATTRLKSKLNDDDCPSAFAVRAMRRFGPAVDTPLQLRMQLKS